MLSILTKPTDVCWVVEVEMNRPYDLEASCKNACGLYGELYSNTYLFFASGSLHATASRGTAPASKDKEDNHILFDFFILISILFYNYVKLFIFLFLV
ncbi:Uncharacterised protein [Chlamydia trachomatis]|nr:Uncharacterised protein [Chlamydia trachomatis]CRH54917.1 Uncharacterised protein [Chlamydia trachomatis]CRH56723.1 Uncharacterised protein [Chlamydia trachomatis]